MKTHILLIDDDADEFNIFVEALDIAGISCKCTWANSGHQATEQLRHLKPDVIFLDLNMPVMDGFQTLECIKSLPDGERLNVILYSTTITADHAQRALALGACHCLQKQDTLNGLAAQVSKILLKDWQHAGSEI